MKPPAFRYHDPRTVEETLQLLAELDGTRVLAGGQSLMPMLNMRLAYPEHLVDINRVTGLSGITCYEPEHVLRLGATTRQRTAETDLLISRRFPLLAEALGHVGHFQTRNRGTVGGSLAHMDPSAELPAVASAAEATVQVASARGTRSIPFADLPRGHLTTDLAADELLLAVDIPLWPPGHGYAFEEFARRHGDFAIVGVAVLVELADGRSSRQVRRCRVSLAGLGPAPVRATETERLLEGRRCTEPVLAEAAEAARWMPATGDETAPVTYRQSLAATLTLRALRRAVGRAEHPADQERGEEVAQ
jgi:aerobic carbon-monoxide dehydrogenase medium subunit